MNTNTTAAEPRGVPNLELAQDERGYAGVQLVQKKGNYRNPSRPLRLTVFANTYGTFEAGFDLTLGEAEELRDWLDTFIADERARAR